MLETSTLETTRSSLTSPGPALNGSPRTSSRAAASLLFSIIPREKQQRTMIRESCASMRAMSCEGLGLRQQNVDPLDYNSLWQYKDFVSQRFWKIPTLSK